MIEAQRFPEDFDGYIVGAPVLDRTGTEMRHLWNARAQDGPGAIAVEKLPLLASTVYKKCDAVDGLIDDPRNCAFEPAADLPKCPMDADGPSCFTSAQMAALQKIYTGVRNSAGNRLFPGQPVGAEVLAPGADGVSRSGWDRSIAGQSFNLLLAESSLKYMDLDPAPGPAWNYRSFDFDVDPTRTRKSGALVNATNPDLDPLKRRGGKISGRAARSRSPPRLRAIRDRAASIRTRHMIRDETEKKCARSCQSIPETSIRRM